jgi:hypothetical protein
MKFSTIMKHPSAFLPVAMSLAALLLVLITVARFPEVVHATDEGAAAHTWQLLIGLQVPIVLWFAATWLPRAPKQALYVLALQAAAGLAALAPVFILGL